MNSVSTDAMTSSVEGRSPSVTAEKAINATNRQKESAAATSADTDADASATTSKDGHVINDKPNAKNGYPGCQRSKETKTSTTSQKSEKIKVHLVAVGSAPILKKSKFLMNADDRFAVAIAFLRKILKLPSGSLFLYVNAAFVPSPDERMGDLFDCFGIREELVIHYSLQEAWG
mmetsp:Transcript_14850/g.35734  ORF Transcript_14850/g.35734 Transcript_14850/m.35734 type:complete len:174 (-) Transcript_14850:215-736(-)